MSFSPDILNKKLGSLQETQDSIVTISQWVLFHHRHSKETAELWAKFILNLSGNSSTKKLSLLYLCNDVVQQARHKRKMDFISDFSKVLPKVLNKVYKSLDPSIKPKVDRLVNVWSERLVFPSNDIKEMKKAIELSKANQTLEKDESADDSAPAAFDAPKTSIASDLKMLNDVFLHMNQLVDISQGNLNQVGIQSKTYLPADPSASDNLPSPKIYISKLNVLEKLCLMSNNNIEEIKKDRVEILKQLDNLRAIMSDGLQTDDSKIGIINKRLDKLKETRSELQGILDEDKPTSRVDDDEEPSPAFDQNEADDDDDDMVPTYENEDSENDDYPPSKKFKPTPESSNNSSLSSAKKSVAFSEDIEVKEYDREDQTESITIIRSDDDDENNIYEDDDEENNSISNDFEKHHKDALELKHEQDNATDDDGYDPSSQSEDNTSESNSSSMNNSVMNLLAKLA